MGKKRSDAEISIGRYLDQDEYDVQTNDPATASTLKKKGWTAVRDGGYWKFKIPAGAVTIRKKRKS